MRREERTRGAGISNVYRNRSLYFARKRTKGGSWEKWGDKGRYFKKLEHESWGGSQVEKWARGKGKGDGRKSSETLTPQKRNISGRDQKKTQRVMRKKRKGRSEGGSPVNVGFGGMCLKEIGSLIPRIQ